MIDLRQNIIKWLSENIAKSFTDENICEKKKKKTSRPNIMQGQFHNMLGWIR